MGKLTLKNWRGVVTHPNQLEVERGALASATNCAFTREGVIQPRRGIPNHSTITSAENIHRLWEFDGYKYAHWDDGSSAYKLSHASGTGTVWTAHTGNFEHPSGADPTDYRLHGTEANGRYYFVENSGLRRIENGGSAPTFAGAPKCPDIDRYNSTNADAAAGILAPQTNMAYRAVVFFEDADGRRSYGSPSGACIFRNTNAAGGSNKSPVVRVLLPVQNGTRSTAITTSYGVQLYRTDASPDLSTDPSDYYALVFEDYVTSTNITNGYVDVADVTPDRMQGPALYTNGTQGTILNANDPPPFAYCIGSYQGCVLLGNIAYRPLLELSILSVDTTSGILNGDTFNITDGTTTLTLTATTGAGGANQFIIETGAPTTSQKIMLTAQNLCAAINRHASNNFVYARYMGVPSNPRTVGSIALEGREPGANAAVTSFSVYVGAGDNATCYEPVLPQGAAGDVESTLETWENGWALSKPGETDAFPVLQNGRCGAGAIIAVAALDDEAFLFHDSGEVWRMSGQVPIDSDPGSLRVEPWRTNLKLLAPSSIQRLDHRLVCMTEQGVVALNGLGYEILSNPLRTTFETAIAKEAANANLRRRTWAVVHPVERRYLLSVFDADADRFTQYVYFAEASDEQGAWSTGGVNSLACGAYLALTRCILYGEYNGVAPADIWSEEATPVYGDGASAATNISATIATPPIVTGDGTTPKQLREIQVVFESGTQPTLTAQVATEHASGSVSNVVTQSSNICRVPVPQAAQRGTRHTITLTIATTAIWRLSAIVLFYREYADKGTK